MNETIQYNMRVCVRVEISFYQSSVNVLLMQLISFPFWRRKKPSKLYNFLLNTNTLLS